MDRKGRIAGACSGAAQGFQARSAPLGMDDHGNGEWMTRNALFLIVGLAACAPLPSQIVEISVSESPVSESPVASAPESFPSAFETEGRTPTSR